MRAREPKPIHPLPKITVHYETVVGRGGTAETYGGPKKTAQGAEAAARWCVAPDGGGGYRWAGVVEVHTITTRHFVKEVKR